MNLGGTAKTFAPIGAFFIFMEVFMERMLSGIKPTGSLTLGNYIGALRQFVKYQEEYEMIAFIANLHCITSYQDPKELRKNLKDTVALYLASGLDPKKTTIFLQSDVPAHATLGFILNCYTYMGELNRMTQFKDKTSKGEANLTAGLYTYPCLMAADILLYDPHYVPVGNDQKQHVELTRDIAERFNNKYSPTFLVPEPLEVKVGARIMSLSDPTRKMSKSDPSNKGCIYLLEDVKSARKKIMGAVTDSYGEIRADKEKQPGLYNLLEIGAALKGETPESLASLFKGKSYGELKTYVADAVEESLSDIQKKYHEILQSDIIDEILKEGAKKANFLANRKLDKVLRKIGLEIR